MKKKYYINIVFVVLLIEVFTFIDFDRDNKNTLKEVVYKGDNLLVSIDGVFSNTLPTSGTYYLVDYKCENANTKLSWDRENNKLNITNGNKEASVVCNLEFKSSPKLSEMPVGSYVSYTGIGGKVGIDSVNCQNGASATDSSLADDAETEAPNSCLGQNAREDIDDNGNTYGYCYYDSYKYYIKGWRIAYIDENNKPVIISAGSPECNSKESIAGNTTYIKKANTKAMKYCNSDYVDGDCSCIDSDNDGYCDCTDIDVDGLCDEIENGTVDAWAVSDIDFYNMTKAISGVGKRLADGSSSLGDIGGTLGETLFCRDKYSREECGYNNDLIDNGGYYWFAARSSSSSTYGVIWSSYNQYVNDYSTSRAYGLRPVISLSSSVVVTGGKGTMEEPYTISNNTFSINSGNKYINSSGDKSNVTLNLVSLSDVTQMCVSVGSSGCSNYVDFTNTYTLDWSSEADAEKIVYVYYKNASGEIVASLTETIIIDTVGPTNSSVEFSADQNDGIFRSLEISSTGADYMCFSNTSSSVSDCTKWRPYSTSYDNWVLETGTGDKTVYVFFRDNAGNIASVSATTTCTIDCDYKYNIDVYNSSYIYLMRNDGATARINTSTSSVEWNIGEVQQMNVCGAYNRSSDAYIWCIGEDNNAYYKKTYTDTVWNKVSIASYIDVDTYDYSIYPYSGSYAYIVRSDGRTNRIDTSGLYGTTWTYAENINMAACSGYSSTRVICVGVDGKYYYRTSALASGSYTVRSFAKLTDTRTSKNTWIDMYYNSYTHIIESDGTNLYDVRFSYSTSTTPIWTTTTIPGTGVRTCAGGGSAAYTYCLGNSNYLYYKSPTASSWTSVALTY